MKNCSKWYKMSPKIRSIIPLNSTSFYNSWLNSNDPELTGILSPMHSGEICFGGCAGGCYILLYPISIFDKDDDGYIPVEEMREILQSLGDKMTDQELDEMMAAADSDKDGFINYEGSNEGISFAYHYILSITDFVTVLCGKQKHQRSSPPRSDGSKKRSSKKAKEKISVLEDNGNKNSDDISEVKNGNFYTIDHATPTLISGHFQTDF